MSGLQKQRSSQVAKAEVKRDITDEVLVRVSEFEEAGALTLPKDYNAGNSLKSAFLLLQKITAKVGNDYRPALEVCSKRSVANALLDMVVQGLNPMKSQGYFIAYGTELAWSRSYMGSIALAKRVGGLKSIKAYAIYEDDKFTYSVDVETGALKLTNYNPALGNIDANKMIGAFAFIILNDGTKYIEIMNMLQIRTSWNMGASKGNSKAHKNFTEEMAKKTVMSKACKLLINTSDDSHLEELVSKEVQEIESEEVVEVVEVEKPVIEIEQISEEEQESETIDPDWA